MTLFSKTLQTSFFLYYFFFSTLTQTFIYGCGKNILGWHQGNKMDGRDVMAYASTLSTLETEAVESL